MLFKEDIIIPMYSSPRAFARAQNKKVSQKVTKVVSYESNEKKPPEKWEWKRDAAHNGNYRD